MIARAAPTTSGFRSLPVLFLLGANLVPLLGVLAFGWSLFELIQVYWLENGIIGAFNLARMATVRGGRPGLAERLGRMAFFTVHYGMFWAIHGVFVVTLFGGGGFLSGGIDPRIFGNVGGVPMPAPWLAPAIATSATVGFAMLSLIASHGVSFVWNWWNGDERSSTTLDELMMQPYARVVVLHLTIIGGGFAVSFLGSPLWALVLMVALKIGVDLAAHRAEHEKLAPSAPSTA